MLHDRISARPIHCSVPRPEFVPIVSHHPHIELHCLYFGHEGGLTHDDRRHYVKHKAGMGLGIGSFVCDPILEQLVAPHMCVWGGGAQGAHQVYLRE